MLLQMLEIYSIECKMLNKEEKAKFEEKLSKASTPYDEQVKIFIKEIDDMKVLIRNTKAKLRALAVIYSKEKNPSYRTELRKYHSQEETQLNTFIKKVDLLQIELLKFKKEANNYKK